MERYRIFDRDTGDTLETRLFDPDNTMQIVQLFEDWPYAAVDWELAD